jgi:hypothetical protein
LFGKRSSKSAPGIAPNLAELLIDLEEVEGVRALVRGELLRLSRRDR